MQIPNNERRLLIQPGSWAHIRHNSRRGGMARRAQLSLVRWMLHLDRWDWVSECSVGRGYKLLGVSTAFESVLQTCSAGAPECHPQVFE